MENVFVGKELNPMQLQKFLLLRDAEDMFAALLAAVVCGRDVRKRPLPDSSEGIPFARLPYRLECGGKALLKPAPLTRWTSKGVDKTGMSCYVDAVN